LIDEVSDFPSESEPQQRATWSTNQPSATPASEKDAKQAGHAAIGSTIVPTEVTANAHSYQVSTLRVLKEAEIKP